MHEISSFWNCVKKLRSITDDLFESGAPKFDLVTSIFLDQTMCHPLKEFKCSNGRCLPVSWKCDEKVDCSFNGKDTSDELNCKG